MLRRRITINELIQELIKLPNESKTKEIVSLSMLPEDYEHIRIKVGNDVISINSYVDVKQKTFKKSDIIYKKELIHDPYDFRADKNGNITVWYAIYDGKKIEKRSTKAECKKHAEKRLELGLDANYGLNT